jgi:RND family efflux transporter MFP subunit
MSTPPRPLAMRASIAKSIAATALSLLAAAAIVGCQPAAGQANAQTPAAAPVPAVTVASAQQQAVAQQFAQVGRVESAHRVEIRARVGGHIEAVLFKEGDLVRAGQPLFRIDARPFDVALQRARAELQLAQAREALARSEAERAQRLARDQAISAEEVERRVAAHAEAVARSAAAQAQVQSAALDREFATITAPLTGRIGRALVTVGNYVAAGATPSLATLNSVAPLHVYFEVGDPALVSEVAGRGRSSRWQAQIVDAHAGALLATAPVDFVDNEMTGQTGTLRLRARIDKPVDGLVPGQFVRVQLAGAPRSSVLVPEQAIASDQGQPFVLVVNSQQQVEYRSVKLGTAQGDQRVIASGIAAGDSVIVSGLMKIRPGMKVQPQPAGAPAQAQGATPNKS